MGQHDRNDVGREARQRLLLFLVGLCASWSVASAQTVLFGFDTGTPGTLDRRERPRQPIRGGITATFGSPSGAAFSLQSDGTTFFRLSQFSRKYLYPKNQNRNVLAVSFSQALSAISLAFATVEYQDNAERPSVIHLTAYSVEPPWGRRPRRATTSATRISSER